MGTYQKGRASLWLHVSRSAIAAQRGWAPSGSMGYMTEAKFPALLKSAVQDLIAGVRRYHLWTAFATEDVLDTYRHTSVGVLWAIFSFSSFALAIILVFGMDSATGPTSAYIGHLVSGLLAWNYLSSIVSQGPSVFISNERFLKGTSMPLSVWAYHFTLRALILNGFAAIGAAVFLILAGYPSSWIALAAVPALLLYVAASIPVQLILGSIGAYTRDVQQVIENLMRAIFFLTPVIWAAEPGSTRYVIAQINPFTPFIDIFRAPLIEGTVPWTSWELATIMTIVLWIVALIVFSYSRLRIVFWV